MGNKGEFSCSVEAPTTNHLRDFVPDLEKYEAVQQNSMWEDRNQEDYKKIGGFISLI